MCAYLITPVTVTQSPAFIDSHYQNGPAVFALLTPSPLLLLSRSVCHGLNGPAVFPLPSPIPSPSPAVNTSMSGGSVSGMLAPGDVVEVCDGELMHLQGKVVGVDGDVVTVLPNHEDLQVCEGKSACVGVRRSLWVLGCRCEGVTA